MLGNIKPILGLCWVQIRPLIGQNETYVHQFADIQTCGKTYCFRTKMPPHVTPNRAYVRLMFCQDGTYIRRLDHIQKREKIQDSRKKCIRP